jgi:flagellar biogenesis protein FliO
VLKLGSHEADRPRLKATLAGGAVLLIFAFAGASMIDDQDKAETTPAAATESEATKPRPDESAQTATVAPARTEELEIEAEAEAEQLASAAASAPRAGKTSTRSLRVPRAESPLTLTRFISSFGIVVLLGVAGVFIGRVFLKRTRMGSRGEKVLQIVDALPLGPKKQIYVIQVEGRRLVVGAGPDSINLLSEFNEEEIATQLAMATEEPIAAPAAGVPHPKEFV